MCESKNNSVSEMLVRCGVALATVGFLSANSAMATCVSEIEAGVVVSPTVAHVGDTIFVQGVDASESSIDCGVTNTAAWLVKPDNSSELIFTNGTIAANQCGACPPGGLPCVAPVSCVGGASFTYVVSAADIDKNLNFTIPPGFAGAGSTLPLTGTNGYVQFFPIASGFSGSGGVRGTGVQPVLIVSPGISVNKFCDSNCFAYGAPITFHGIVCNTGDDILTNVTVVDSPGATITFATTTTLGNPFLGTLVSNDCVTFTGTYQPTGNFCGPFTDTVIATGTDGAGLGGIIGDTNFVAKTVHATNSATCDVCTVPCIAVTKVCSPPVITNNPSAGLLGIVNFSGYVTNCGNVPLTNVVVTDTFLGGTVLTVPFLTNGASVPYSTNFQTTSNECGGTFTNTVIATGHDACDGSAVTNRASCEFTVVCVQPPPDIGVTKQVACFLGTNESGEICGTYSNSAVGIRSDTDDPAFCYEITVTNPGPVALTNVSVIDSAFGDLTADFPCVSQGFPPQFAVGAFCSYTFKASVGHDLTNVVNDIGYSIVSGQRTNATANAVVTVYPASVTCLKQYTIDGGPLTNDAVLPDSGPHTIVWYVTVSNPSTNVNLGNVVVTDVTTNLPGCTITLPPFSLDAGSNIVFLVCSNSSISCTNGFDGITNTINVTASEFSLGTNHLPVCSIDINGSNIVVSSECEAFLGCSHPSACRVTGGGRQDEPNVYPPNVRYVTHGGQVGAPVGDRICTVTAQFPIGNPCIHGRWTHVRHMLGGLEGNFHARFYDTLQCACLDTSTTSAVVTIPGVDGQSPQTYTDLVYGPGTIEDAVCNPGDKIAGPEPSPAPANKIAFTGIGDYALTQGNRAPVSVLFRVDVEDRSEPGGSHPGGGKPPPDRNRTRIWILTSSELAALHGNGGPGSDNLLLNFRNAISACNGINVQDGASVTNGAPAFGVRKPDIDDGGELDRGNYQIHPSILNCDPNNPVGPGLAKP